VLLLLLLVLLVLLLVLLLLVLLLVLLLWSKERRGLGAIEGGVLATRGLRGRGRE